MSAVAPRSLADHYPAALKLARARFPGLSAEDHEDIVQEALANVWARLRKGPLEDERSYLLRVVHNCGVRVLAARKRTLSVDVDQEEGGGPALEAIDRSVQPASVEDQVLAGAERQRMRRIIEEQLSREEGAALVLRTVGDMEPAQVARALRCSDRRYRKLLERAGRKFAAALTSERREEILALYVMRAATRREREQAEAMLATPQGAALLEAIRRRVQGATALLPLPLVADLEAQRPGLLERVARAIVSALEGVLEAIRGIAVTAHGRWMGLDHATSPVVAGGGLRGSGAAVAVAVACGTSVYCAAEGLPDALRRLPSELLGGQTEKSSAKNRPATKKRATATPVMVATPPPRVVWHRAAPVRRRSRTAERERQERQVEEQFGIERVSAQNAATRPSPRPQASAANRAAECQFGIEAC